MNTITEHSVSSTDGTATGGRKGIAYDWQSLLAADGVAAIEAELADLVLESAPR
jgi:hypothetical protein